MSAPSAAAEEDFCVIPSPEEKPLKVSYLERSPIKGAESLRNIAYENPCEIGFRRRKRVDGVFFFSRHDGP